LGKLLTHTHASITKQYKLVLVKGLVNELLMTPNTQICLQHLTATSTTMQPQVMYS